MCSYLSIFEQYLSKHSIIKIETSFNANMHCNNGKYVYYKINGIHIYHYILSDNLSDLHILKIRVICKSYYIILKSDNFALDH